LNLRSAISASIVVSIFASAVATGCAGAPDTQRATIIDAEVLPSYTAFKEYVNPYLENRCASLDCHGQPGRGYRIYSQKGLRLYDPEARLVSGRQATSEEEKQANYDGLIGLEPEETRRVVAENGNDPMRLLLLRKPTARERHKGGQVMGISGDAGYRCITEWLRVREPQTALSPSGVTACEEARKL